MKGKFIAATLSVLVGLGATVPIANIGVTTGKVIATYKDGGQKHTEFKTEDKNGWIVPGAKWKKGKKYIMVFDNKGTKDIYDDEIIKIVKY